MTEFKNGSVYKGPDGVFTLINFRDQTWGMMYLERSARGGGTAPIFQRSRKGRFQFTENELHSKWRAAEWVLLDGCVRLEKIYTDDLWPEHSIGKLEPVTTKGTLPK